METKKKLAFVAPTMRMVQLNHHTPLLAGSGDTVASKKGYDTTDLDDWDN